MDSRAGSVVNQNKNIKKKLKHKKLMHSKSSPSTVLQRQFRENQKTVDFMEERICGTDGFQVWSDRLRE